MKTEFKGLTQSTIKLLNKEENVDVDFKREGIESEDIVAFANSKNGGVILIGVDEIKDEPGKVIKGKIVGTKVGDPEKLKIINKATDCLPPIQVKITYENIDDLPIIKVIIPSGPFRPYCTRRGVYKTRVNGRNAPLDPDQLFEIFFEREGKKFIERFQEATKGLMNELNKLVENFEVAEKKISDSLEGISSSADEAESNSMDTQSTVDEVYSMLIYLNEKVLDLQFDIESCELRERLIMRKLEIEDPRFAAFKKEIISLFNKKINEAKTRKEYPSREIIINYAENWLKQFRLNLLKVELEEMYNSIKH